MYVENFDLLNNIGQVLLLFVCMVWLQTPRFGQSDISYFDKVSKMEINPGFTSFLCLATLLAWLSPDVQKISQLSKIWRRWTHESKDRGFKIDTQKNAHLPLSRSTWRRNSVVAILSLYKNNAVLDGCRTVSYKWMVDGIRVGWSIEQLTRLIIF